MKNRMAFFNGRALFVGLGLSHILSMTGTDFWISCILGTLIGVIILSIIKNVNNYKILKMIVGFIFALLPCCILVNMGHSLYLKNTPVLVLAFTAVLGAFIIGQSEKSAITKASFIFYIYSMFLFWGKFLFLQPYVRPENLLPSFTVGAGRIIKSSFIFALTGVVPILGLNDLKDKKETILTYLISMITVTSIAFLIITVLGPKEAVLYRYPEYVVLKRIKLLNFVSNVDNIFTFAIVGDLLFTMAAGFNNIGVKGKITQFIAPILVIIFSTIISFQNWPLIYLYDYLPILIIFLLILILFPKKNMYKVKRK